MPRAGAELGIDHATVLHGIRQLDSMNTGGYERELEILRDFNRILESDIDAED